MKKNILLKGVAGLLVAAAMTPAVTSCSSDYLDLTPITSVSAADVANSLDGARYAMQGLCSSMYRQMGDMNWNNTCGQPYYCMMYGEALGNTYHDRIWNVYASNITDWTQMRTPGSMTSNYMWYFCYGLINAANQILDNIDNLQLSDPNDEKDRKFIKAATLAVRSHAYIQLMQVYGPRWIDSNNGAAISAIVLRTSGAMGNDVPFATTGEVVTRIFTDLNDAIALYNEAGAQSYPLFVPNVNVAHGLKARIAAIKAVTKEDWQVVRDEAKAARQGYEIMSADQYVRGGFVKANQEYLWATWFQSEGMYYYSHGGTYACNGWTVASWGVSNGIDFDLYRKIPLTDIRKGLYIAPGGFLELNQDLADAYGLTDADFFDAKKVNSSAITFTGGEKKDWVNFINDYACDSSKWPDQTGTELPLTSPWEGGPFPYYNAAYLVLGLQYKFWGVDSFATNQFPYMRASEMGYLEAEAEYEMGNEAAARAILIELNKDKRDPNFTCTESGTALRDKIRAYRHIELWGEGFTWFDLKRWNVTLNRTAWKAGDVNSGNYPANLVTGKCWAPSDKEGWRASVPTSEFNYNKAVHVEDLPGSNR